MNAFFSKATGIESDKNTDNMKKLLLFIAAGMDCAACTTGNVPEAQGSITVNVADGGRIHTPRMCHHSQQQMVEGDFRWTAEAVLGR